MSRIFEIKNEKKGKKKYRGKKRRKKKKDMKKRTTVALCRSVSSNISLGLPVFFSLFFPSGVAMASMALLFPTLPLFATSLCPPSSLSQ